MPNHISYKELPLWQRSIQLVVDIYQLTSQLPAAERLSLSTTLQQSAVSIPTILASGTRRGRTGFRLACLDARESIAELETQLIIAQQLYTNLPLGNLLDDVADLERATDVMIQRLASTKPKPTPKTV